jgi:hypothetical protein
LGYQIKNILSLFYLLQQRLKNKNMQHNATSIRPFMGSKNFEISRNFYSGLGFEEFIIDSNMSAFKTDNIAFYLQNAYEKDWIENTMIFIEIKDVEEHWKEIQALDLVNKYQGVKITSIFRNEWGDEYHLLDPAGNLLHFGTFKK